MEEQVRERSVSHFPLRLSGAHPCIFRYDRSVSIE